MRLAEVATIDAIVKDGPVLSLDLTGSRRNTPAGRRRVPIHSDLSSRFPIVCRQAVDFACVVGMASPRGLEPLLPP